MIAKRTALKGIPRPHVRGSTEPPDPVDNGHRNRRRSYNKNTTKSHSVYGVYEKTAAISVDFASYGLYMTHMKVVQYSGSSGGNPVKIQVLSRAQWKRQPSGCLFRCGDLRKDLKRASADQREDEPPWMAAKASEAAWNPESG